MDDELKVIIEKFDVDWKEIKNRARGTIGLQDSEKEPTDEWIKKMLLAEHSVLRHSFISIKIENVPFYVMGHLVRHNIGVTPYVQTSRSDRTGVDRSQKSQTDLISMRLDLNVQSLINISRKRLCNQASSETKKVWEKVIEEVSKYDKNVAWACVKEGIYKGGCSEGFSGCFVCNDFLDTLTKEQLINLKERYTAYRDYLEQMETIRDR